MHETRALEGSGIYCWDLTGCGGAQCGIFGGDQYLLLWHGDTGGNINIDIYNELGKRVSMYFYLPLPNLTYELWLNSS